MIVRVRLFAQQRQLLGRREETVEVPAGATVRDAWERLVASHPVLARGSASVRFARNASYADPDEVLADGDELAVIPPVAGGAEPTHECRLEVIDAPIDDGLLAELRRSVPTAADGALVLFVGQARETPGTAAPGEEEAAAAHAGKRVVGLEYEAFSVMAEAVFAEIAGEIAARYGVRRLAIVHRTGVVAVGEASVVIAAAAEHRAAAFDACCYAIEELKARAPIWKAEHFGDGSVWLGAPARTGPPDRPAEARGEGGHP